MAKSAACSTQFLIFLAELCLTIFIHTRFSNCQSYNCRDVHLKPTSCRPGAENVVRGRNIGVTPKGSTCGVGKESEYCRPTPPKTCSKCNNSNPSLSHKPTNMQDNDLTSIFWGIQGYKPTWWQSITWWDASQTGLLIDNTVKVNLTLSMNKSHDLTGDIKITFYSSRPNAMMIERSADNGITWKPYRYFADQCNIRYPSVPIRLSDVTQAICVQSSNAVAKQGETITFNPMAGITSDIFWNITHIRATDVRIRLEYPWTDGNHVIKQKTYLNQYYYDITDLQIFGRCHCNGHAPFCEGPLDQSVCKCEHNTAGISCERCLPLYNNRTWMPGGSVLPNECQQCECNSHAQSCVYNSTLGFGVCNDCIHNTIGFFCHECKDKFYRNLSLPITDQNVCNSCGCFLPGTTDNGSCTQVSSSNVTIGQCSCKSSFHGRRCDSCKDGYYGVTVSPVGVCKACNCSLTGSLGGSFTCDEISGRCLCKQSTNGRTCNVCKDGFHSFPNSTNGQCQTCVCNQGGAYSNVCNKTAGQCFCRSNMEGISCDSAKSNFFIPSFDFLRTEAESSGGNFNVISDLTGHGVYFTGFGYARIDSNGQVTAYFQPKFNARYSLVIRYKHLSSEPLHISAILRKNVNSVSLPLIVYNITLPFSNGSFPMVFYDPQQYFLLKDGNYSITVLFANSTIANQTLDIDSIILMWDYQQTKFYQAANLTTKNASTSCWQNKLRITTNSLDSMTCQRIALSINSELFNGSQACNCNPIGTLNNTNCAKYGGQCQCKPGVTGRTCDQCVSGFYGFSTAGCTACNCSSLGSISLVCDVITGQCPCKPGVVNRTCSECRSNFYGHHTGKGCNNCSCNWDGSADVSCDTNGACTCKNTTMGEKCDKCIPLHYNFTKNGCMPCNCDTSGSTNVQCDLQYGNCSCKQNTEGTKCNTCKTGTFNLKSSNPHGCQPCFCFNKTKQCASSTGYYSFDIRSTFINSSDNWLVRTANGLVFSHTNTSGGLLVRTTDVNPVFYHAPSKYLGNKLSSYSQILTIELTLKLHLGNLSPIKGSILFIRSNNSHVSFVIPVNTTTQRQSFRVRLHELNTVERVSAWRLQNVLSSIKSLTIQFNTTGIANITLHDIRLVSSSNSIVSSVLSSYVENCSCPLNFTGNSCSNCGSGYTRIIPGSGSYTDCKPCACSSRSITCDPETGICNNCRIGTEGDYCERCQFGVVKPQCTTCLPGYYGFNDTSVPGCKPCNCLLVNTPNENTTTCDGITGQCACKQKIGGKICDRCAENAVNITNNATYAGCQTCPECYRLIQVEVQVLRLDIANITNRFASVKNIAQLEMSPSFGNRLTMLTSNVKNLFSNAQNSSSVESGLVQELAALNMSLDSMQKVLDQNISNGISQTDAALVVINGTKNQITDLRVVIHNLVWASNYVLHRDIVNKRNATATLANDLGKASTNMTNFWIKYEPKYTETANINSQLLTFVANATNVTAESSSATVEVLSVVNTSNTILKQQRVLLQGLETGINTLQSNLNELINNITTLSLNVNQTQTNAQALNPTTVPSVAELQVRTQTLNNSARNLSSTLITLSANYVGILDGLVTHKNRTVSLNNSLFGAENEMKSLAARATNARNTAAAAVSNANIVEKEAKEMLGIVKNFNDTSKAAKDMAALSLQNTDEVNTTSLRTINYINSIKNDLNVAVSLASQSLSIATNASLIATDVSQVLNTLLNASRNLYSDSSASQYKEVYFSNIFNNVSTSIVQKRSDECKNYTTLAESSGINANVAMNAAENVSKKVTSKQSELNKVIGDFQRMTTLNASSLLNLQQTLQRNRQGFDQSSIATTIKLLKNSYLTQQNVMSLYLQTITRLKAGIADAKRMVDQISMLKECP